MQFTQPSILELVLNGASFLAILFVGLGIFLKNPKSWTNRFFLILTIILDLYTIVNIFSLHPIYPTATNQLFWIRLVTALMTLMTFVVFLLSHTFPKKEIRLKNKYIYILFAITLVVAVVGALTPYGYKSLSYPNGSPVPEPGFMMPIILIYCVFMLVASFVILIRRYRSQVGIERIGAKYFLFGMVSTFSLIAIFVFVFVVILKSSGLVFLGPVFPVILVVSIAYSITKYSFLDIRPIIARAVSYVLLLGSIIGIYFVLLFLGTSLLFGIYLNLPTFLINTSLGLVVAFTFRPLRSAIMRATDKFFFKDKYNSEKILSDLTHAISRTIKFNDLANKLLDIIIKELRVSKAAIILVSNGQIDDARSIGYTNSNLLNDPKLFVFLEQLKFADETQNKNYFVMSELEAKQKEFFRAHEMEAVFPINADGKNVAILVLGIKSSGLPYSTQDLNILDVFAGESGIAIQNAKLYNNLQLAFESKNNFIKVVSHQLRTPMSGVKWSLEELENEKDEKQKKHLINTSYQKVIFINEQLDDILTALDIYDKKVSLDKISCDVMEICKRIIENFKYQIKFNNLNIKYQIAEDVRIIDADFNKLTKIFEVLIKNAILYSQTNGEVLINAKSELINNQPSVVFNIVDYGIGITEIEKNNIFDQFYRSDRAKLKLPDGLGLGMFIAKTFIEYHNGTIEIHSEGENKGTTVEFVLPIN